MFEKSPCGSSVYVKMSEIEELSQFLTLKTRIDVKALALQQTLGNFWM